MLVFWIAKYCIFAVCSRTVFLAEVSMNSRNSLSKQKSIARMSVNLINTQGATWSSLEEFFNRDRVTIQRYLRVVHYGLPEDSRTPDSELTTCQRRNKTIYQNLLQKAAQNAKAEAEAKKAINTVEYNFIPEDTTAIVVETGYLMFCAYSQNGEHSLNSFVGNEIFIPKFCFTELQSLSLRNSYADEAFSFVKRNNFTTISLNKEQEEDLLTVYPSPSLKPRVRGVAAVCSELFFNGLKVHLFTTSKDIEHLVLSQGFGDSVIVSYIPCSHL